MRIYILYFLIATGLLTFVTGCYKDKGNYNYVPVNTVTISGIDSSYTVDYGQPFTLTPTLLLSKDSVNNTYDSTKYSYEWIAINPGALKASQKTLLATTRDLNTKITLAPTRYTVYYRITEKSTGIQWQQTFYLVVSTTVYEGWLILCNVNDSSRLDMLSYKDGKYRTIVNVLDTVGSGLPPQGKPYSVTYSPYSPTTTGIYICTQTGTNRVDQNYFKWSSNLNIKYEMLSTVPDNFTADFISLGSTSQTQYMLANKNFYYYYYSFNIYFGLPINQISGENGTFTPAPFIAPGQNINGAILYDQDHQRFVKHVVSSTSCIPITADSSLFSFTPRKSMRYMTFTPYGGGEVFSVLKDDQTGKSYLARFTFTDKSLQQTYYAEVTGTDFDKAEQFAVSPNLGYLFYSVGGKVYEYDMGLQQSILMLDKGGDQVSLLKFHRFVSSKYSLGTTAPLLANKLIVGSYSKTKPEGSNGTMELYAVPQVNGALQLYESYTGLGKIVSVGYRER